MPANRNALIRYKVIDNCLQNRFQKWTLDTLIQKVSDALYEYEGIDKNIGKRTIQADIQVMRSDKLGYNAPIVITDRKYYTYDDPTYSITNIPLSASDLAKMNEAVDMLKQFKGFSHFSQLNDVVQKLEDHVYSSTKKSFPIINFEKNEHLKGLALLDVLYQSVVQQTPVEITYQSFKARDTSTFAFHVWWLKEFKNRWFAVGVKDETKLMFNLALDRFITVGQLADGTYIENNELSPELYYRHILGVTVDPSRRPRKVRLVVNQQHAPYVKTKPLHHSQTILEETKQGITIELTVQLNYELEKEILSFGEGITVVHPLRLQKIIWGRQVASVKQYEPFMPMETK